MGLSPKILQKGSVLVTKFGRKAICTTKKQTYKAVT